MPGIKSIKNTRNIDMYNRIDTPLQGSLCSTATVFIRWPYSLHTFDRVLRNIVSIYTEYCHYPNGLVGMSTFLVEPGVSHWGHCLLLHNFITRTLLSIEFHTAQPLS
jgi:hypothetical protein